MLAMNLFGILFLAIVFRTPSSASDASASSSLQGVSLKNLKQLLRNPSFEHTWRPKGSGDGSAFTLSGTNLDDWQSFRVGHAPLAKPFISHAGMNALKMEQSGYGLGVMQHVEVRSEKPAKVILTAWVAADKLQTPPSISGPKSCFFGCKGGY